MIVTSMTARWLSVSMELVLMESTPTRVSAIKGIWHRHIHTYLKHFYHCSHSYLHLCNCSTTCMLAIQVHCVKEG